jgi:hypothetical protein
VYDLRTLQPARAGADGAVPVRLEPGDAAVFLIAQVKAFASVKGLMLSRRVALAKRAMQAVIQEAQANGVPDKLWAPALSRAQAAEAKRDWALALARMTEARSGGEAALRADARYQRCRQPFDQATAALSRASRDLEVWVLKQWPNPPSGALPMIREDAALMGQVNTLKELARCQHLLRYALLTGKTEGLEGAYGDLAALARQAGEGVGAFVKRQASPTVDEATLKRLKEAVVAVKA